VAPQQPDRVKVKTMAALFASLALIAAQGAHTAVRALPGGFGGSGAFTVSTTNDAFASLGQPSVLRLYEAGWAGPACTIVGTQGPDLLFGTEHRDVICGLGGNDRIYGLGGNDIIFGGPGNDTLSGGSGNDIIYGGPGNDRIQGDDGRDIMYGGTGNDTFWAWDGYADRIDGGPGYDRAWKDKLDHVINVESFS
jgi:Ca2+-binding RTX toxin-like protein